MSKSAVLKKSVFILIWIGVNLNFFEAWSRRKIEKYKWHKETY